MSTVSTLSFALFLLLASYSQAQTYTSWLTGSAADVSPATTAGVVLMGGATEHDEAMRWLLNRANGGDVVVLRASGSDGYNDYLYTDLGVTVNSVETLLLPDASAASDPYVLMQVSQAEAIWIAGGDQWDYVSGWRGAALGDLLNEHVNIKGAPIGGTSAGMAILGGAYFSAENGTVTSAQALANPFHPNLTVESANFLNLPHLEDVITDTHYDAPDRKGRHMAFLARLAQDNNRRFYGIACDEYTAVAIDESGMARVFGDYPSYDDIAYFLQVNCTEPFLPEDCSAGNDLDWYRGGAAVKVYRVPGDWNGTPTFDLNTWEDGTGGSWEDWSVDLGSFQEASGTAADCAPSSTNGPKYPESVSVGPLPVSSILRLADLRPGEQYSLVNTFGQVLRSLEAEDFAAELSVQNLPAGIYFLQSESSLTPISIQH